MDPLTHGLAALALVKATGNGFSVAEPVLLAAVAGSVVPDFDIIFRLRGRESYLRHHRAFSHSPAGLVLGAVLIGAIGELIFGFSWSQVFFWSLIGSISHTLLDLLNYYGVKFCLKGKCRRLGWGILGLTDPWLIFTLTATGLASGFSGVWLGLAASGIYLAFRCWLSVRVRAKVSRHFGIPGEKIMIMPSAFKVWHWEFIAEGELLTTVGQVQIFPAAVTVYRQLRRRSLKNPIIRAALRSPVGKWFREFTPHFHASVRREGGLYLVELADLRYYVHQRFLHRATVVLDQGLHPVTEVLHPFGADGYSRSAVN